MEDSYAKNNNNIKSNENINKDIKSNENIDEIDFDESINKNESKNSEETEIANINNKKSNNYMEIISGTNTPLILEMNDQNKSTKNILNKMFDDFKDDFNDLSSIKNELKKLKKKEIFFILFIWLVWVTNLSIYISKNLSNLFFSNVNIKILFLTFFFGSFFMITKTLNLIKRKLLSSYAYIIFWGYFILLFVILCKSLLYSNWGWQFYLIIILINLNLIIFPKFNIKYIKKND